MRHPPSQQEFRALQNLQQQGYECYLPLLPVEKLQRGTVVASAGSAVPPPLPFVKLDPSMQAKSWAPIRSTKGVSRLVSFGGQPTPVDEALVLGLQREDRLRGAQAMFQAGDTVQLVGGAFSGLDAIYEMRDGEARALVLIEMLSKPVRLRVSQASLRRVV